MRLETAKYLYDVKSAATALAGFVDARDWPGYKERGQRTGSGLLSDPQ